MKLDFNNQRRSISTLALFPLKKNESYFVSTMGLLPYIQHGWIVLQVLNTKHARLNVGGYALRTSWHPSRSTGTCAILTTCDPWKLTPYMTTTKWSLHLTSLKHANSNHKVNTINYPRSRNTRKRIWIPQLKVRITISVVVTYRISKAWLGIVCLLWAPQTYLTTKWTSWRTSSIFVNRGKFVLGDSILIDFQSTCKFVVHEVVL